MAVLQPKTKVAEPSEASGNGSIPSLKQGDRVTRDEFERRYTAMPDLKTAELIEGVVHVSSPVRQRLHGRPHSHLNFWLSAYEGSTRGVEAGDNSTIRLDLLNERQPDCLLFVQPEYGGQVRINEDGYIEGAPELVAEVAASSVDLDLGTKRDAYRRNGVREYIVWRVLDQRIEWYVLRNDAFELNVPQADGTLRSQVFPGLWLDPASLIRGDVNQVLTVVQQGLASPEHHEYVARLEQTRIA
jgi:Uma2 family endonuclease